jgi:hypothetical protein
MFSLTGLITIQGIVEGDVLEASVGAFVFLMALGTLWYTRKM